MERKKKEEKLKMKAEKEARKVSTSYPLFPCLSFSLSLPLSVFHLLIVEQPALLFRRQGAPLFVIGLVCFRCKLFH